MPYEIRLSSQAAKDRRLLKEAGLEAKARELLRIIGENPYQMPPRYEKLSGNMRNFYSRRINVQHRLVYEVDEANRVVRVLRMWSHYGDNCHL